MRCLVVGGGGFIGSHLCEALLEEAHDVTVFDRGTAPNLERLKQKGAILVVGDFFNPEDIQNSLRDQDVVFHLLSATVPQTSNDDPIYDVESNIIGTLRLLDLARRNRVKKIIFASSGGTVYGIPQQIPIKESHPTDPISSYGITKLAIEKYLHMYWHLYGLDYRVLRISNAYGERQPVTDIQGVVSAFMSKALRQEDITVWGDGAVVRDYIYVGNIVDAFLKVLIYNGEIRVFNIGAGQGHNLNDIIRAIEGIVEYSLQIKYTAGRLFDIPVNVLDISSAEIYLGWTPKIGFIEGMLRTYAWMKSNH